MTIQQINNGEQGKSVRDKLNETIIEANKVDNKMDKVPAALENSVAVFDALGNVKEGSGNIEFPSIDFIPQTPTEQPYKLARIFYDTTENTWTAYNDINGIGLQLGEELRARLINDTGGVLLNGKAVSISGASGASLTVELLDCSKIDSARRAFGLMTIDTADGQDGYTVRYGAVRDMDTSAFEVGEIVYGNPSDKGGLINFSPDAPDYPVRIGIIIVKDAINGVIGVDTLSFNSSDTAVNLEGSINGIAPKEQGITLVIDGGNVYADVINKKFPLEDLPFLLNDDTYKLNTTTGAGVDGAARIQLTAGTSFGNQVLNRIYIELVADVPTLKVYQNEPSTAFVSLGGFSLPSVANMQANNDEPFAYRRTNNAVDLLNGINDGGKGIIEDILSAIRDKLQSNWISGQDATETVNNATISYVLTAGIARQFRKQSVGPFNGLEYWIFNDITNTVTYEKTADLINIVADASGNTLLSNNTFYTIRTYQLLNSEGIPNRIIATRPSGSYSSGAAAISDASSYNTKFNDTDKEGVVYPLYDFVISRTGAGGTTVTLVQLTDNRTKFPLSAGGGGASGGGGTDDKIRITAADTVNDYLNPKFTVGDEFTKEITAPAANESLLIKFKGWIFNTARNLKAIFNTESLTVDRTLTVQDKDGTIALLSDIGGGGGHEYLENGVAQTARAGRNVLTNGSKAIFNDDAVNDETEESIYFEVALDVDPTGKQAGDVWGVNSAGDTTEPIATAPDEKILPASNEPNLSADGLLIGVIIPAGYKIESITVQETAGNAAGNISLGTAALGTQIVNAFTVGASADNIMILAGDYFSSVNDTDIYVSSSAWGTGIIQLNFVMIKTI